MLTEARGYSLISLMISLACGLSLLAGLSSLVASVRITQQLTLEQSALEQEVQRLSALVYAQLQESGQTGNVTSELLSSGLLNTTFLSAFAVSSHPDEASDSCLLFARDDNNDGILSRIPVNENKGLRLRDKALEIRTGGKACHQNGWHDVSDPGFVQVDALTFVVTPSLQGRTIKVIISLSLASAPMINRQTTLTVRLRNG